MPLLKKVMKIGNASAVILPQQYIDYWRAKGSEIREVEMEIDEKIIITPIARRKKEKNGK